MFLRRKYFVNLQDSKRKDAKKRTREGENSMNMDVYMPTRLITGKDCIKKNTKEFSKLGKRCLIMTGKHSAKVSGALDDVLAALEKEEIFWVHYDGIGQNPRLVDCMEAAEIARKEKLSFIIGIGGGSPLDAAKCAAVFAVNPDLTEEGLYSLNWKEKPLPIIAVGTTAGTGSEVTKVAVITTLEGKKKSFKNDDIFPVVSFGDPSYTLTLSDTFTKSTAVDALAHCVESYFSRLANEISKLYAIRGVCILMKQLKALLEDERKELSFEARKELYHASIYGGLAINVTGTCAPHTMGYLLTEEYGFPHGVACATFLPAFFAYNEEVKPELTKEFLEQIHTTKEEFLTTIQKVLPSFTAKMSEEDIKKQHRRWIGNASLEKGWGNFSPELADQILRALFLEKK